MTDGRLRFDRSGSRTRNPPQGGRLAGSSASWSGTGCELIGRERVAAELAQLIRAHAVVAVVGPLGVGKTALVRQVVERGAAAGRGAPGGHAALAGGGGAARRHWAPG